jgi:glutathione S-transferase
VQPLVDFLVDRRIAFEDHRIELGGGEWAAMREDRELSGPFASLPVLRWGDLVLAEVLPIASFLTRTLCASGELAPAVIARHDMLCSASYLDVLRPLADLLWCRIDCPEISLTKRARIVLPRVFAKLRRIGSAIELKSSYIGGDTPAVADFFVLEALEELAYVMGPQAHLLGSALAELEGYRQRLRARPAMQRLFAGTRHPRYTASPDERQVLTELESFPWPAIARG